MYIHIKYFHTFSVYENVFTPKKANCGMSAVYTIEAKLHVGTRE